MINKPQDTFESDLKQLIYKIWELQYRIEEVMEFERQWKQVFDRISEQTGIANPLIHIKDYYILRAYRWDKHQLISIDLLSIICNEIADPSSIFRRLEEHIYIEPIEIYLLEARKIEPSIVHHAQFPFISEEHDNQLREESIIRQANHQRNALIEKFTATFGAFNDSPPTFQQAEKLRNQLREIKNKIKGIRDAYAHKNEARAFNAHKPSLANSNIQFFNSITSEFFSLVRDVALIYNRMSYADHTEINRTSISNQIDLILFGSYEKAQNKYRDGQKKEEKLWRARETFFNSYRVEDLLIKK